MITRLPAAPYSNRAQRLIFSAPHRRQFSRCVAVYFAGAVLLARPFAHAVTVILAPGRVNSALSGEVQLAIGGVAVGQTVQVEKFADLNRNNQIDPADVLVQSFRLMDGKGSSIGGVRNPVVPGDDDGLANGQICSAVKLGLQEAERGYGIYLYRVSAVTGGFAPVNASLTIVEPASQPRVTGRILNGTAGVAYAFVALLTLEDEQIVAAGSADGNGTFSFPANPGTYVLAALRPGYVFDFQEARLVALSPGSTTTQNLPLRPATGPVISGRISDASDGAAMAGVQLWMESANGLVTTALSDLSGNFSAPVSSADSDWKVMIADGATQLSGCLEDPGQEVNTSLGNVSNVAFRLIPGTSLIHGRVVNERNEPLPGIPMRANRGPLAGAGKTDESGQYYIPVLDGEWQVMAEQEPAAGLGLIAPSSRAALAKGQALQLDLRARRITAHLRGRTVDERGAPAAGLTIGASDFAGTTVVARTDSGGEFELGVFGATWHLQVISEDSNATGLVGADITVAVLDGTDVSGISYAVRHTTTRVTGSLRSAVGLGLPDVHVFATAMVNGQPFRVNSTTDANGLFHLRVFDAMWQIGVECWSLEQRGLVCVSDQTVPVLGGEPSVSFVASGSRPLTLAQPEQLPSGRFRLRAYNVSGNRRYLLEATSDLNIWTPITSLNPVGGMLEYFEAPPTGLRHRFYRVRQEN